MKTPSSTLLAGSLGIFLAASAFALTPPIDNPASKPLPRMAGLTLTLQTSAAEVVVPGEAAAQNKKQIPLGVKVQLRNGGKKGIPFLFPDQDAADRKFNISVFDDAGQLVWSNTMMFALSARADAEGGPAPDGVELILGPLKTWRASMTVPLLVGGQPLAEGEYRIEAELADSPDSSVTASAFFSVVKENSVAGKPTPTPKPESGVLGTVMVAQDLAVVLGWPSDEPMPKPLPDFPLAGATVELSQLAALYGAPSNGIVDTLVRDIPVASGTTDENGNYSIAAPPGTYRVRVFKEFGGKRVELVILPDNRIRPMVQGDDLAPLILPMPPIRLGNMISIRRGNYLVHDIRVRQAETEISFSSSSSSFSSSSYYSEGSAFEIAGPGWLFHVIGYPESE
jgi:hypothetical protein